MNQPSLPWALLVVGNPSASVAVRSGSAADPPSTVLGRALSLTSLAKTSCLIEDRLRSEWNAVIQQLWPENVRSLTPTEPTLDGVTRRLEAIGAQEPDATVILIPFNHCAVEELTWLASAKGAIRLGSGNRNTVYCLHDNPDNDPRSSLVKPEVCTSSVLVGSTSALLKLCRGAPNPNIVDLVVEQPIDGDHAMFTDVAGPEGALNLVHVRLVEEYARLQRQDVWHRKARQLDLHA